MLCTLFHNNCTSTKITSGSARIFTPRKVWWIAVEMHRSKLRRATQIRKLEKKWFLRTENYVEDFECCWFKFELKIWSRSIFLCRRVTSSRMSCSPLNISKALSDHIFLLLYLHSVLWNYPAFCILAMTWFCGRESGGHYIWNEKTMYLWKRQDPQLQLPNASGPSLWKTHHGNSVHWHSFLQTPIEISLTEWSRPIIKLRKNMICNRHMHSKESIYFRCQTPMVFRINVT